MRRCGDRSSASHRAVRRRDRSVSVSSPYQAPLSQHRHSTCYLTAAAHAISQPLHMLSHSRCAHAISQPLRTCYLTAPHSRHRSNAATLCNAPTCHYGDLHTSRPPHMLPIAYKTPHPLNEYPLARSHRLGTVDCAILRGSATRMHPGHVCAEPKSRERHPPYEALHHIYS